MIFGEPWWLWELAGVGVFALLLLVLAIGRRGSRHQRVRWPRIARVVAAGTGVRPVPAGRTVRRPWLLLLALAAVIVALAHPQWGTIDEPVFEQAREVMIALDLSRSMLVPDVPPSRLERAKLLMQSLLDNLRGERVGVTVFAGTAFVQVPLSPDYRIIQDFLPELKPDYMPQGGTDFEGMLRAVLDAFGTEANTDRFLIVLSDGESHSTQWRDLLPELKQRGVRVLALGVGTAAGGFIPDVPDGYVKDARGAVVLSRLEPATLRALAAETGGVFRDGSEWVDLAALIETTVARGREGQFSARRNERHLERFQWFLAPAVALALAGLWREIAVRPRQQAVRPRGSAPTARNTLVAGAALVLAFVFTSDLRAAAPPPPDEEPAARVRETIARLAGSPAPSARDWRELADRTLVYGTGARMNQQEIATGAIEDALVAVDRGEQADPRFTDWKKLRTDLRALLAPPPEETPPEQPPPQEQQQQQQQQEENQEQSQDQSGASSSPPAEPPPEESPGQQPSPGDEPSASGEPPPASAAPKEGSLGELQPETGETPPPSATRPETAPKTRKIGAKPAGEAPPPTDAETAVLLELLRQTAEEDSPARLHQLLQEKSKAAPERGRDW